MLKTGIYVDAENIRLCGGYGMRYDVLVDLASAGDSVMLRANSYLAEDRERTKDDPDYRQKLYRYHNVLRQCGFKVIKKYVKHFVDDEGIITTKANADMDLAIDALLQARNLDRIILLTGDGDFIRLVLALQNMGCRVEVLAFKHVSHELKEAADSFLSGFLVPGLLPIHGNGETNRQRGFPINYNPDRGFGFMRYYTLSSEGLTPESVFFHCSKAPEINDNLFVDSSNIFEFDVVTNPDNGNRTEAWDIRSLDD
ncbi:NYN domain-containing protein [Desulfosediminicola flagellatus]|uniref:LabA-like NYN domain-containing protein n=1 Tax=Desulfosediminicola flagellatus TaxID=2569541 RepID=UPI0010AC166C|nr:NYN domain-containing protein [Desulfosediminicola flagellatus]